MSRKCARCGDEYEPYLCPECSESGLPKEVIEDKDSLIESLRREVEELKGRIWKALASRDGLVDEADDLADAALARASTAERQLEEYREAVKWLLACLPHHPSTSAALVENPTNSPREQAIVWSSIDKLRSLASSIIGQQQPSGTERGGAT